MPQLHLDVHVAPMRPMQGAPAQGPGDEPMWSPMSATLIYGERDAVLVDTLVTFDQVDALADWVLPRTVGESQQYLRDFSHVVAEHDGVEDIVGAMLELHPDRDNPRVVWHCAREAVKNREKA